uniref:Protein osiris 3 n=1 Tax=Anopheles atroparvus TaxID=41427 RepID=A0AAG5D1I9_ANOAO
NMAFVRVLLVVCSLVALIDLEDSFIRRLGGKCTQKDNSSCVMLKLVTYMNRMLKKSTISLGDSLELMKTRDEQLADPDSEELAVLARSTTSDDHKLSVMVADKIWRFIHSRSIRWKATRAADVVVASGENGKLNFGVSLDTRRLFEEGRGRLKQYAPILAAVVMKAVLLGALVLKGIALLVGKALLVSKLALVLASVLGIKKLLHKKYVTYEVVAHAPEPHHHVDTYSSGWARALDGFVESFSNELSRRLLTDPHEMAYHKQQQQHQLQLPTH